MKKAQGLSLNTIVIAALVLIVLVILIVLLSGKMGSFKKGIDSCDGYCTNSASDCKEDETPIYIINCDANSDGKADGGNYCCMKQKWKKHND